MNIIENLNSDQSNQLYELYKNVWFTQGRKLIDVENMLSNSYLTLGIIDNDELIGFCRAISDGVYKAFLFDVIVKDRKQGHGIGKLLIETALAHEKLKNVNHIELYCPESISPFYERLGFEIRTSLLMRNRK